MKLNENARNLLESYLSRLRVALEARGDVDAREVEQDVREHVREALHDLRGPVEARSMQQVLDAMGNPVEWAPDTSPAAGISAAIARERHDDWNLAYVSLALLLLAFALPPFLWVFAFGAFLTARASLCATRDGSEASRAAQGWLRNPSLLLLYVPAVMLLLLWPAIAMRIGADLIVDHAELALRLPVEVAWLAERIAEIRLSNFDPSTTLASAVRSGHWLLFPVGCWLIVLAALVAICPRAFGRVFRPFVRSERYLAYTLVFCGGLFAATAVMLALLKQTLGAGSPI